MLPLASRWIMPPEACNNCPALYCQTLLLNFIPVMKIPSRGGDGASSCPGWDALKEEMPVDAFSEVGERLHLLLTPVVSRAEPQAGTGHFLPVEL